MGAKLGLVTDLILIAMGLLVGGMLLTRPTAPAPPSGYARGDILPTISGVDLSRHQRNILLVVSSNCRFCTDSMGFYRTLIDKRNSTASDVSVIVVTAEDIDTSHAYLASHKLRPDTVVSVGPDAFKVPGTPYVVLADSTGKVIDTWLGQISSGSEEPMIAKVFQTR